MGIDISVGESLDDLADLLERAHAPFRDLTWEQIFPMPTAGALAGDLTADPEQLSRSHHLNDLKNKFQQNCQGQGQGQGQA